MGRASTRQTYWVTATPWGDATLSATAVEVAGKASASSGCPKKDRERIREFILNLSMNCLPDARWNYFWPDLHREISKRLPEGKSRPTESELTNFSRNVLLATDGIALSKLLSQGIHHRFIALIFEQAGIGKDRNRIISRFLGWLVEYRSSHTTSNATGWTDKALGAYLEIQPEALRSDILLLGPVLANIGAELIALVTAIEARPERSEMIEWQWDQLRRWWIAELGADLDTLTPSAASVLREWITRLSSIWTRADIFRLTRVGRISCRWPDGSDSSSYSSRLGMPLGFANIKDGQVVRSIVVVDSKNLSHTDLVNLGRDIWHAIGDDYLCKVSDEAFSESHPEFGFVRSVPVFAHAQDRDPGLHFWGRRLESSTGIRSPSSKLTVPVQFKWRAGRLLVAFGPVRAPIREGEGFSLRSAGSRLWVGNVRNGTLCKWNRPHISVDRLLNSGETTLKFSLMHDEEIIAERTVPVWPLLDDAFLVCGGTVCPPAEPVVRWIETGDKNWRTSLIVGPRVRDFSLSNVTETGRRQLTIRESEYTEIELAAHSGARALVRANELRWSIEFRTRLGLTYFSDHEVSRDSISFTGAGNIRVIDSFQEARLKCSRPVTASAVDSDLGLWLTSNGIEGFCKLDDSSVDRNDDDCTISVGQLANQSGLDFHSGMLTARIGTLSAPGKGSYNFFLPPLKAQVEPVRLGQFSYVELDFAGESLRLTSDLPVSPRDVHEAKFCHSPMTGDGWEVTARWKPEIFDIVIDGLPGAECGYRYKLFPVTQRSLPASIACRMVSTRRASCSLEFTGSTFQVSPGDELDLLPLVKSEMARQCIAKAILMGRTAGIQVNWEIDASPCVSHLAADVVSELNGLMQVSVRLTLASLFPSELDISVSCGSQEPDVKSFWTDGGLGLESTCSIAFMVRRSTKADREIRITVQHDNEQIHCSSHLIPNAEIADERDDGEMTQRLVKAYRETGAPDYLTEIIFAFLRELADGTSIRPATRLSSKVGIGKNPEEESALVQSLKMLEKIGASASTFVRLPSLIGAAQPLGALVSAIWLFHSERYASAGILSPEDFSRAATLTRTAMASLDVRIKAVAWLAYEYARRVERKHMLATTISWAPSIGRAPELVGSDVTVRLGKLCPELTTWLEATDE